MTREATTKCVRCGVAIPDDAFRAPVAGGGSGVWDLKCYTFMTGFDAHGNRVAALLSKDELKTELARREAQEQADERLRKNEEAERIIQNIDALLLLVPNHDRTSCSDTSFSENAGHARCTRCVLLEAESDGYWRNDIDLTITANFDPAHATVQN